MKQFYLLLFAMICLPGLLEAQISVGDEFIVDGIRYETTGINTLQVISGGDYAGELTIPANIEYQNVNYFVTAIADRTFNDCISLTSIYIPESITSIGTGALEIYSDVFASSVRAALTIDIDPDNTAYLCEGNVVYNKQKTKLVFCSALNTGSFEIPETVTEIGPEAFGLCMNLTSIDIPVSVTSIGSFAFGACRGLNELYVHNSVPPHLDFVEEFPGNSIFAFMDITKCTLYVPAGSKSAYQAAEGWKDFDIVEMNVVTALEEKVIIPLNITVNNNSLQITNTEIPAAVAIFDIQGRAIYKSDLTPSQLVKTPALHTGIYIVKASTSKGIFARKIVVQ